MFPREFEKFQGILNLIMVASIQLSEAQNELIALPLSEHIFLDGKAGCGKTTAAIERLRKILNSPVSGSEVLVLLPSKTSSQKYYETYSIEGKRATINTYNGLIQKAIKLFWPVVAEEAGFASPEKSPIFLTIETSQILMAELIKPKIEAGYFSALRMPLSRIYNQIQIALHKCAAAEFSFDSYAQRMRSSWSGDSAMVNVFDQVQECGNLFRKVCFENNLLDYSIQVEIFQNFLLPSDRFQKWLKTNYHHLIYDNIEEDIPAAHRFAEILGESCESVLMVMDHLGGFRNFMGSDTNSAFRLSEKCPVKRTFTDSFICEPAIRAMIHAIENPWIPTETLSANPKTAYIFQSFHPYPVMIHQAAQDVAELINRQNVEPSEIAIIAPLLSDVLYTALERELRIQNISCYIHRPSRPLIQEKETKGYLVLIALLHPEWGILPRMLEICEMLQIFIPSLDPIRAQILVSHGFQVQTGGKFQYYTMKPYSEFSESPQNRIGQKHCTCYETLRNWIRENFSASEAPDLTLTRFFHEILVSEGFAARSGEVAMISLGIQKVIESMKKYRLVIEKLENPLINWSDYLKLVWEGMISARYYEEWYSQPKDSVLISLSSSYALMNRPVSYQIWLNAGSPRWWERIYGQITNDYILSQDWKMGDLWDATSVYEKNDENMHRLVLSLLSRCRKQVRVYTSELNESGQDQKSKLLYVFSELSYRFNRDSSVWPAAMIQEDVPLSTDTGFYPGIDDISNESKTQISDFYPEEDIRHWEENME